MESNLKGTSKNHLLLLTPTLLLYVKREKVEFLEAPSRQINKNRGFDI